MQKLQPGKLFSEPHIIVAGEYSLTTYRSDAVTMVEVVMAEIPDWLSYPDEAHAHEVSSTEFQDSFLVKDESKLRENPPSSVEQRVGRVEIELISGSKVHAKLGLPFEQITLVTRLFAAPNLHFSRLGGGETFINTKNVIRLEFCPGPPNVPATALRARHLVE